MDPDEFDGKRLIFARDGLIDEGETKPSYDWVLDLERWHNGGDLDQEAFFSNAYQFELDGPRGRDNDEFHSSDDEVVLQSELSEADYSKEKDPSVPEFVCRNCPCEEPVAVEIGGVKMSVTAGSSGGKTPCCHDAYVYSKAPWLRNKEDVRDLDPDRSILKATLEDNAKLIKKFNQLATSKSRRRMDYSTLHVRQAMDAEKYEGFNNFQTSPFHSQTSKIHDAKHSASAPATPRGSKKPKEFSDPSSAEKIPNDQECKSSCDIRNIIQSKLTSAIASKKDRLKPAVECVESELPIELEDPAVMMELALQDVAKDNLIFQRVKEEMEEQRKANNDNPKGNCVIQRPSLQDNNASNAEGNETPPVAGGNKDGNEEVLECPVMLALRPPPGFESMQQDQQQPESIVVVPHGSGDDSCKYNAEENLAQDVFQQASVSTKAVHNRGEDNPLEVQAIMQYSPARDSRNDMIFGNTMGPHYGNYTQGSIWPTLQQQQLTNGSSRQSNKTREDQSQPLQLGAMNPNQMQNVYSCGPVYQQQQNARLWQGAPRMMSYGPSSGAAVPPYIANLSAGGGGYYQYQQQQQQSKNPHQQQHYIQRHHPYPQSVSVVGPGPTYGTVVNASTAGTYVVNSSARSDDSRRVVSYPRGMWADVQRNSNPQPERITKLIQDSVRAGICFGNNHQQSLRQQQQFGAQSQTGQSSEPEFEVLHQRSLVPTGSLEALLEETKKQMNEVRKNSRSARMLLNIPITAMTGASAGKHKSSAVSDDPSGLGSSSDSIITSKKHQKSSGRHGGEQDDPSNSGDTTEGNPPEKRPTRTASLSDLQLCVNLRPSNINFPPCAAPKVIKGKTIERKK